MRRILLCVDGSVYTESACACAVWWAKRMAASLRILYVSDLRSFEIPAFADLSGSLGVQPYQGVGVQLQEIEKEKAAILEERCRGFLESADFNQDSLTFTHVTGSLVDTFQELQGSVVGAVLGKRGEHADFAKGHLGSMMERIVRTATLPVWVAARQFKPIHRVLLAYDGSAMCQRALEYLSTAGLLEGTLLHLVTVAEDRESEVNAQNLRDAETHLQGHGISPECQILGGEPEDAIAAYVEEQAIDLLVMGAYGHSRIRHFLIGSTTSEMLRRCRVPVLCIR